MVSTVKVGTKCTPTRPVPLWEEVQVRNDQGQFAEAIGKPVRLLYSPPLQQVQSDRALPGYPRTKLERRPIARRRSHAAVESYCTSQPIYCSSPPPSPGRAMPISNRQAEEVRAHLRMRL